LHAAVAGADVLNATLVKIGAKLARLVSEHIHEALVTLAQSKPHRHPVLAFAASRAFVSMKGFMQDYPLVVTSILDYAARYHAEQEVISRTVEGGTHRYTYADMHKRAQLCSLAFHKLGVRQVDSQDLRAL